MMKKKECPSCAMEIDAAARSCPICQYEFSEKSSGLKWVSIALAALLILYLVLQLF